GPPRQARRHGPADYAGPGLVARPGVHAGRARQNVDEGSPAARAGLKQGDVITQYNGKAVVDNNQLRNSVAATTPGSTVTMQVSRDGRTQNLTATVGELEAKKGRPESSSDERAEGGKYGMTVQSTDEGLTVTDLDPNGIAAESNMQVGDVIEKVDGKAVTSAAAL